MKKSAFFLIIIAGIMWGTSGLFVNALSPLGLSSLQMTNVRGFVAAICMVIYALIRDRSLFKMSKGDFVLAISGGISIFLTSWTYFASIQASSVATAVVLMYTAPVMVMGFSVAFLGEKLTKMKMLSIVLMLIGCALVSGIIGGAEINLPGVLLGLAAGVSYSAYNIFTKLQMRKGSNPVSSSMYSFIGMGLVSLIVSNPAHTVSVAAGSVTYALPLMIALGVCTCVLPYFLYTVALKNIPVGTAAALGIVEPMAATIFSIMFLGERLSVPSAIGIVLVIGSVFLLSRAEK
ncbi:MAG: EamA family transporter [Clostridia bacterium]|nr:EamA family transporter [Clostridia bacterium]